MQPVRLFVYDEYVKAVVVTGYEGTENMPISNTKLKAYKGSNQTIKFGIFDSDGKPFVGDVIAPEDFNLALSVVDTRSNREVIYKDLSLSVTPAKVPGRVKQSVKRPITYYECELTRADLQDLDANAPYTYTVFQKDENNIQNGYLYTALDYDVPGEFEVLDTASAQFTPSTDTGSSKDWILVDPNLGAAYENMDKAIVGANRTEALSNGWVLYASSVYAADAQLGYIDGLHTAAVYPDGLTGILRISGSLSNNTPQLDFNQWFPIPDVNGNVYHKYTESNTVDQINFKGNFMWIRYDLYVQEYPNLMYHKPPHDPWPDQGSIQKILFRV